MTEQHKPVPPYDYTRTQRSRRRKAQLNGIAQEHGFASWSSLETACINGAALAVYTKQIPPDVVRRLYEVTAGDLDNDAQHPR